MKNIISKREQEILDLISYGFTDKEISHQLYLSPYTVKDHRRNIIGKLACRNSAGMVRRAFELQLLPIVEKRPDLW